MITTAPPSPCPPPEQGSSAFSWAGIAYAVYGLFVHLGGFETILWMDKWAYRGSLAIPAVTAGFAFLLGPGCAQSWNTRPEREQA